MKWSKKLCIQYIQAMRSPIEEQSGQIPQQGGLLARLKSIRDKTMGAS